MFNRFYNQQRHGLLTHQSLQSEINMGSQRWQLERCFNGGKLNLQWVSSAQIFSSPFTLMVPISEKILNSKSPVSRSQPPGGRRSPSPNDRKGGPKKDQSMPPAKEQRSEGSGTKQQPQEPTVDHSLETVLKGLGLSHLLNAFLSHGRVW